MGTVGLISGVNQFAAPSGSQRGNSRRDRITHHHGLGATDTLLLHDFAFPLPPEQGETTPLGQAKRQWDASVFVRVVASNSLPFFHSINLYTARSSRADRPHKLPSVVVDKMTRACKISRPRYQWRASWAECACAGGCTERGYVRSF